VWDVNEGICHRSTHGETRNYAEANFIKKLLTTFSIQHCDVKGISIGIITFYNDQVALLQKKLMTGQPRKWINSAKINLQISTVDGFQGSEKDIIILSCVRSNEQMNYVGKWENNIGFLRDFRRVNVALTRARESLWIICNCEFLQVNSLWKELIWDASSRELIARTNLLHQTSQGEKGRGNRDN